MQSVNSFIKLLGKNYYSDLITEINSEIIDFEKYYVVVNYQNVLFYELSNEEIAIKRNIFISNIKECYHEALTEIYAAILSHDSLKINTYLDFNTDAVKRHLNILKRDFYIDDEQSRYFSVIDDNPQLLDLSNKYQRKLKKDEVILNEDISKLFNNAKHENFESIYTVEYLYDRNKTLSLIPFSLFVIGQKFILQIDKIKLKINPTIPLINKKTKPKIKSSKKTSKEETYFESFLKLLDNTLILKKSTAIGIMVDFKMYINEIKSEVLAEIQTKGENRNDYLDFLINEIEKQHYVKNVDISCVEKWLDDYKISIDDIFDMKYQNNTIRAVIDSHYIDMDKYSPEKDKAHLLQSDFRDYFCNYYADELIKYIKSIKHIDNHKPGKELIQSPKYDFLDAFLIEISNERDVYQSTFIQCYDFGILSYTEKLKKEINENILNLTDDKVKPYLELVKGKLFDSPYYLTSENCLDSWIASYSLENQSFPFLENEEVKNLISKSINYYLWDEKDRELMEDIQLDFYYYAAMTEAKKIIAFLEELTPNFQIESKTTKQEVEIDTIFKSSEAFTTFNFLIKKFDITTINIKKRGAQAQLNAIWGCPKSRKEIFKEHAELREYVNFLNQIFLTSFKSRTMSDGSKYHNSIKEWLN